MKVCLKCGRGLLDRDIICDKCGCNDIMDKNEFKKLYDKFKSSSLAEQQILRNSEEYKIICKYKFVVDTKNTEDKRKLQSQLDKENNRKNEIKLHQEYKNMQEQAYKIQSEKKSKIINIPKCPTCGSENVKKITLLNRAVSIGMLGLLSGKIGKNYECKDCGSKW